MDVDVEPCFTNVDSDVDWRGASFEQNLALHAGLAPCHLFRPGAKGERIQLIHGTDPRAARSRSTDLRGVAAPRRLTANLSDFGRSHHARDRVDGVNLSGILVKGSRFH